MNEPIESAEVRIHPAQWGDQLALLTLIEQYYAYDEIHFDRNAIESGLTQLLGDAAPGQAWFIRRRGDTVGYAIATFGFDLEFGGKLATLTDLFLLPLWRRKGLGTRALQLIEVACKAAGARALELQPETDNIEAIEFYRSLGYETLTRIPMSKYLI